MITWMKGQKAAYIFFSICLLVIVSPGFSEAARNASVPVSKSGNYLDNAITPIPISVLNEVSRFRRGEIGRETATANDKTGSSGIWSTAAPILYSTTDNSGHLDSLNITAFQQACQLLDIPPPSSLLS